MPRNITNNDLAAMVKRGFDDVTNRMAKKADVDKQFEVVDKRLGRLEMEAGHTNARLSVIERDVAEIRKHFVYF